jgi:hypothetical protein
MLAWGLNKEKKKMCNTCSVHVYNILVIKSMNGSTWRPRQRWEIISKWTLDKQVVKM